VKSKPDLVSDNVRATDDSLLVEELIVERGGKKVLHGVNLEIEPGAVTALLGANGAGKSSLVMAIGGLLPTASGRISRNGLSLVGLRPERIRAHGVAIVPEGRRLLRSMSVHDNLRVATHMMRPGEARSSIDDVLVLFPELGPRLKIAAGALSGGEQQMVAIAQAVAVKPAFLCIDELSLGLAPVVVKRLMPVLTRIASTGVGVLLIEQFAHVALEVAAVAYVMEGGRIRYRGSTSELRADPEILRSAYLTKD
jgi:branched-chain amino acid transport system ATP-binding protein